MPASSVAKQCLQAIIDSRREIDLSPRIQKVATLLRTIAPELVDHRIQEQVEKMRSAFIALQDERQRE